MLGRRPKQVWHPPTEKLQGKPNTIENETSPHQQVKPFQEREAEQDGRETEEKIEGRLSKRHRLITAGLIVPGTKRNPRAELKIHSE
jgi:hypothetical protein